MSFGLEHVYVFGHDMPISRTMYWAVLHIGWFVCGIQTISANPATQLSMALD